MGDTLKSNLNRVINPGVEIRRLDHADYTVGWICAISCELTAALAALDEKHEVLSNPPGDYNIYSYGEIAGHNVVISCLPEGIYGTTTATVVATRMLATFSSITIPLMVGVAGGVPSPRNDIRLGDVVVSVPTPDCPAVVQYDYGKTVASGKLERKGSLNKPSLQLLAAVSNIRAHLPFVEESLSRAIRKMLNELDSQGFGYPNENDVLYEAGCEHVDELELCSICGPVRTIKRTSRFESMQFFNAEERSNKTTLLPVPKVHYGPVASGNQVMKNSRIRDEIAQPLGILCFEMESAGLMDILPCLVIRGICDYCDARKVKSFQGYSAIAAAAYAKMILLIVPPKDQVRLLAAKDHFNAVGITPRMMAIRNASPDTCTWLLRHPAYSEWLDDEKLGDNHGILWIKGKPGAGKSTLMNYIRKQLEAKHVLISFFFNARGGDVEKSTSGMYRSLLSQLIKAFPTLQMQLDTSHLPSAGEQWSLSLLQRLFVFTITQLEQQSLFCLVDALDESAEDDIRDMVEVFKEIGELTASRTTRFRVLWSSRYYPHISINLGLEIQLDKVGDHSQDLQRYINQELPSDDSQMLDEIKASIFSKSAGIFLWVVLVIRLLKKEYDHGRIHAMRKTLAGLPEKLSDLFRDIILRDMNNLDEFILCLQFVLYSDQALNGREFYSAMMTVLEGTAISMSDSPEITNEVITRYITSTSRGLVELTYHNHGVVAGPAYSSKTTVQFIHESVREFLLLKDSMLSISPSFRELSEGNSHERLKDCCMQYLTNARSQVLFTSQDSFTAAATRFPFIRYAISSVLLHAEEACRSGSSEAHMLDGDTIDYWFEVSGIFKGLISSFLPKTPEGRILCHLACENLHFLLRLHLSRREHGSNHNEELFDFPLYHAMEYYSFRTVSVLLSPALKGLSEDDIEELCTAFSEHKPSSRTSFFAWYKSMGFDSQG